jgi:uncharacterized damage-inducible protein DinB
MSEPEPWLRGPLDAVPAFAQPLFFSFQQVREDLARFTAGLTQEQIWQQVGGSSVGFHLKHMAGSVDRLATYLFDAQLSTEQLQRLKQEQTPDLPIEVLLEQVSAAFEHAERRILTLDPGQLFASRTVGRKQLPTTVIGLLTHIAEHTQRHLGQLIVIAKAIRQQG